MRADADALVLARLADAIVFVVAARSTPAGTARRAVRRLHRAGAPLAGALVTRVDAAELGAYGAHERRDAHAALDPDASGDDGHEARPAARLALTHDERRALHRDDDDFELGMGGEDPTADLTTDLTEDLGAELGRGLDRAPDRGPEHGPGRGLGGEPGPDARPAYDPLAYDPDVDEEYDDRHVNALVARMMAESAGRRAAPTAPSRPAPVADDDDTGRVPTRTATRPRAAGRRRHRGDDSDIL